MAVYNISYKITKDQCNDTLYAAGNILFEANITSEKGAFEVQKQASKIVLHPEDGESKFPSDAHFVVISFNKL